MMPVGTTTLITEGGGQGTQGGASTTVILSQCASMKCNITVTASTGITSTHEGPLAVQGLRHSSRVPSIMYTSVNTHATPHRPLQVVDRLQVRGGQGRCA